MDYTSFCRLPYRSKKKFIEIATEWYDSLKKKNTRR